MPITGIEPSTCVITGQCATDPMREYILAYSRVFYHNNIIYIYLVNVYYRKLHGHCILDRSIKVDNTRMPQP